MARLSKAVALVFALVLLAAFPVFARSLTIVSPNGGEWYEPGQTVYIRWTYSGTDWHSNDTVKLEYSANSGGAWTRIQNHVDYNAASFAWNTAGLPSALAYKVRVTFSSNSSIYDTSDADFRIGVDTTPPVINHQPLPSTNSTSGPYRVCAVVTDSRQLGSVRLFWKKNGGTYASLTMEPSGNPNEYCADIPGPGAIGDQFAYYIEAVDASSAHNTKTDPAEGGTDPHAFNIGLCGTIQVTGSLLGNSTGGCAGNVYYCTRDTVLKSIDQYLTLQSSSRMSFFVYQGSSRTGTYGKCFEAVIDGMPAGTGWYSSGETLPVTLSAGRYYIIGCGSATALSPLCVFADRSTAFGTLQGSYSGTYGPEPMTTADPASSFYRQKLNTCRPQGTLTLTKPNGGEWYNPGQSVIPITWTAQGTGWQTGDTVHLDYSTDSGSTWTRFSNPMPYSQGSYDMSASSMPNSEHCRIRVISDLDAAISDMSDADFTVMPDTFPPVIVHTPKPDTHLLCEPYAITAEVTDNFSLGEVYLYWSKNGGDFIRTVMARDGNTYTGQIWGAPRIGDRFCYYIWAKDNAFPYNQATNPTGAPGTTHCFSVLPCGTDTIGSDQSARSGTVRQSGNQYNCSWDCDLTQIEHYLDVSASTELTFFVYEAPYPAAQYTLIHQTAVPNSGPGKGWYSSGPISVQLSASKSYIIGVAWQGNVTYHTSDSGHGSCKVMIGSSAYGYHGYDYPPLSTTATNLSPLVHYQRLSSCRVSRALSVTAPDGGEWYEPGNAVPVTWSCRGAYWHPEDTVRLEYSADGGGSWAQVPGAASLVYNAGSFSWDTTGLVESDHYRMRVVFNGDPSVSDASDADFKLGLNTTPPVITHTPLADTGSVSGPYRICANITGNPGVASATLYWSRNGGEFTAVPMALSGDRYCAEFPGSGYLGDRYCYYIEAVSSAMGAGMGRSPAGAPAESYCFSTIPCSIDTVGDATSTSSGYIRGDIYYCSTESVLGEVQQYINRGQSSDMAFFVYECPTKTGSYALLYSKTVPNPGVGEKWYSSGPISVALTPGRYYLIGFLCPWGAERFYCRQSTPVTPTAFGQLEGGYDTTSGSVDPAINVLLVNSLGYYQQISTCRVARELGIFYPNGGQQLEPGTNMGIQWTHKGVNWLPDDKVRIDYSTDSGATWTQIPGAEVVPYTPSVFTWDTTGFPASDHYRVRVTFTGDETVQASSASDFRMKTDVTPPVIDHTPLKDTHLPQTFNVYATVTDDYMGVLNVTLWYRKNSGMWTSATMTLSGGMYHSYLPGKDAKTGDYFEYYIEAKDKAVAQNASCSPTTGYHTFHIVPIPDFFTELFGVEYSPYSVGGPDFDLQNLSVKFTPDGSYGYYKACVTPITSLPTDPVGSTVLSLSDNSCVQVYPTDGRKVSLYGQEYTSFWVSSNGNVTFKYGDSSYAESLYNHWYQPRVDVFWHDFDPSSTVAARKVSWKQLPDRVAVTYENVPEKGTTNSNTFQLEMFIDGTIVMSYLHMDARKGLIGLSWGPYPYTPPGRYPTSDFSDYPPCCPADVNTSDTAAPSTDGVVSYGIVPVGASRQEHASIASSGDCDLWIGKVQLLKCCEDFSDGLAQGWQSNGDAPWTVESGCYHADRTQYKSEASAVHIGSTHSDFYYEARVRLNQDIADPLGLVFRCTPDFRWGRGSGYLLSVHNYSTGYATWTLWRQMNGRMAMMKSTTTPALKPFSLWNKLAVNVVGGTIELFANDVLIYTVVDSRPLAAGYLGLDARGGQVSSFESWWDDVAVEDAHPLGGGSANLVTAGAFRLQNPPVLPIILPPGQSLSLDLLYSPTIMGESEAFIRLVSTDPDDMSPVLSLKGTAYSMTPASLLKGLKDLTRVGIGGNIVSAVIGNVFYVQDKDRSGGIGVLWDQAMPALGDSPIISGTITGLMGERLVQATAVQPGASGPEPLPLGMPNRCIGGRDFLTNSPSPETPMIVMGQRGVVGGVGLNNIGLLVKTWGEVVELVGDPVASVKITDGSGEPLEVLLAMGVSAPALHSRVFVTGIGSCSKDDLGYLHPLLKIRRPGDIVSME